MLGGQAVIEGVMMRAPGMVATAVRKADGSIVVKKEPHVSPGERFWLFKLPILRGAAGLIDMLIIGIRTLNYSAEIAMADAEGGANGTPRPKSSGKHTAQLGLTVALSLVGGLALFFAAPLYLATRFFSVEQDPLAFNLVAGLIRVAIFLGYLGLLSLMKDVLRLFQYHGAEHKTVFAQEKGKGLSVDACRTQSRFHPRCGTSFLLVVMVTAILLFAMWDALLIHWVGQITVFLRLGTHLILLPLIMGVSYEFIRLSARHSETPLGRLIVLPGLLLQRLPTKEPDDRQLEVAVVALRAALGQDLPDAATMKAVTSQLISVN
jgi:uncharacterized protein YqhQ